MNEMVLFFLEDKCLRYVNETKKGEIFISPFFLFFEWIIFQV
jgi:hypothetical protein